MTAAPGEHDCCAVVLWLQYLYFTISCTILTPPLPPHTGEAAAEYYDRNIVHWCLTTPDSVLCTSEMFQSV